MLLTCFDVECLWRISRRRLQSDSLSFDNVNSLLRAVIDSFTTLWKQQHWKRQYMDERARRVQDDSCQGVVACNSLKAPRGPQKASIRANT